MVKDKRYDGYKAYDYLEPGIDYKEFNLRKGVVPEWAYTVPLSKPEEERFQALIQNNIVISLHEHPCYYPDPIEASPYLPPEGRQFLAYKDLSLSGLDCVFDNVMDGRSTINTKHGWDWNSTVHDLGMRICDIDHQSFVIHCRKVEDIKTAHREGKLAWVAVLESSTCIENEVDRLDVLYGIGVRSMGITYSESNMLGTGLKEPGDSGLSDFGYDALVRMNKLGILVDVSHCGDKTAADTIELSKDPLCISHCGAKSVMPTTRMLPDDVLQACAERGGVLGVEVAGFGVRSEKHPEGHLEGFLDHLEYCIELMGIDHVGVGPDTMYGDHVGQYRVHRERANDIGLGHYTRPGKTASPAPSYPPIEYVRGMENPSECLMNTARSLILRGYSDEEIIKVIGGNGLRVMEQVW